MTEISKACKIDGVVLKKKIAFTKNQISKFYEIDIRTLERYLELFNDEFKKFISNEPDLRWKCCFEILYFFDYVKVN